MRLSQTVENYKDFENATHLKTHNKNHTYNQKYCKRYVYKERAVLIINKCF